MLLLSVNGFDRVLLNEALKRSYVEPQRSTNLDAGHLPQPGFSVNGVYFEPQVSGGLPDVQEPPAMFSLNKIAGLVAMAAFDSCLVIALCAARATRRSLLKTRECDPVFPDAQKKSPRAAGGSRS
jgi:hypothetical protein